MKTLTVRDKVSELTGIVRELVRDAMGTKDVRNMLAIVHDLEKHLYGLASWSAHATFTVQAGRAKVELVGGRIHGCEQMTWDGHADGDALKNLGETDYLTTPEMLTLLLKVAAA